MPNIVSQIKQKTMNCKEFTPIGIDISKKTFDTYFCGKSSSYSNDPKGFQKLMNTMPKNSWCVMESTSTYGYRLADELYKRGFTVSIVNPLVVKRYSQMKMRRTKTDRADAKMLAEYAEIGDLQKYEPASKEMSELQQLETVLEQLIKQHTALTNQMEALQQLPQYSENAEKPMLAVISTLNEQIKAIQTKMKENAQKACPEALEKAVSVVGISDRTALLLLATTYGFTRFANAKQLSAYFGTCTRTYQSGTSVRGKGHICKLGLNQVRATLYMCAMSAKKHNKACKALYDRLLEKGKPKKVALLAVVNKLIHQVFAVVSKNVFFDNNYKISLGN